MKQFSIIERNANGARIAQLVSNFEVKIKIVKRVVFLDFVDDQTATLLFQTFFPIDYKGYKDFDDFSEKGQRLLLERLSEVIVSDICAFVLGKYDGVAYPDEPYYSFNGCFDIVPYMGYWAGCYNLISEDEDILDEYIAPAEKAGGKR